jgi:hypothetical protein
VESRTLDAQEDKEHNNILSVGDSHGLISELAEKEDLPNIEMSLIFFQRADRHTDMAELRNKMLQRMYHKIESHCNIGLLTES